MMHSKPTLAALAGVTLLFALGACEKAPGDAAGETAAETADRPNLIASLDDVGDLSTARTLIEQAGLEDAFEGPAPYTMFLPTDDALKSLDAETSARLTSDEGRPELIALLRYHIVPGVITRQDLLNAIDSGGSAVELANVAGSMLMMQKQGERIGIGNDDQAAMVVGDPIETGNGVIYRIDRLIAPEA